MTAEVIKISGALPALYCESLMPSFCTLILLMPVSHYLRVAGVQILVKNAATEIAENQFAEERFDAIVTPGGLVFIVPPTCAPFDFAPFALPTATRK
jgi:hypothetical protein